MASFHTEIAVRFADVDHAGIVYDPVFLHHFHVAFEEMFHLELLDLAKFRAIPVPDDLRRLFLELSEQA